MTKNKIINLSLLSALIFTTACGGNTVKQSLGLGRSIPDEFKVISNVPLSVPPEFNLRPPKPGAKRPQQVDLDDQARDVLLGSNDYYNGGVASSLTDGSSIANRSELVLLQRTSGIKTDPAIREKLDEENRVISEEEKKRTWWDEVVEYTRGEDPHEDSVISPGKEKKRIDENLKQGKPINEGDTAVVKKDKKGLLNRLFGI